MESEEAERGRLRRRIEGTLIQKESPKNVNDLRIAHALRRSDGADIVKRNASRKKRYLMVFPGGMTLQPGAKIGQLEGLSTRTPRLTIECAAGRLELKGSLAFPNNALILVKGGTLVKVVDCFEVAIVFGEWAWIGTKQSNPGGVPEPIPAMIRDPLSSSTTVWSSQRRSISVANENGSAITEQPGITSNKRKPVSFINDDDDFMSDDNISDDIPEPAALDEIEPESTRPTRKRKKSIIETVDDDGDVSGDILGGDEVQAVDTEVDVHAPRPTRKRKKSIIDALDDDDIDDEPTKDDGGANDDVDDDDDEVIFLDEDNFDDDDD